MSDSRLLKIGLLGGAVAAACCFTPVLPILLGGMGLSAWLASADFVLIPPLLIFASITVVGLLRRKQGDIESGDRAEAE